MGAWFEHLTANDRVRTALQSTMVPTKSCLGNTCGVMSGSTPLIFSKLLAALPIEIQDALKSNIPERNSWQFSLAVFRSFELHTIAIVLEELQGVTSD